MPSVNTGLPPSLDFRFQPGAVVQLLIGVLRVVFLDRIDDGQAMERFTQIQRFALIGEGGGAQHFALRCKAEQAFGVVHQVFVIPIGFVELHHGEFGVVAGAHPPSLRKLRLISNTFQTADHQAFQIQLRRDARYKGMSSALWWVTNGLPTRRPESGASSVFPLPDSRG